LKLVWPQFTRAHTIHRVVQVNVRQIVLHALLLGLVFSALLAIPFVIYQRIESDNNLRLLQAEQERVIKLAVGAIHQEMDAILSDLRYLSQHSELRNYLTDLKRSSRLDLAREYLGLVRQKRIYDQVRIIGLNGKELVRVNFNDGSPTIVADQDLQDRRASRCFEEALRLSPGQIYVSPLDVNTGPEVVDQPRKPSMRFAAPVADEQGRVRGMLVLNYLGQRLRDKLDTLEGQKDNLWLLNAQGDWLIGTAPQQSALIDQAHPKRRLDRVFPRLWQQMQTDPVGMYRSANSWILFERVYPLRGETKAAGAPSMPVDADRFYWTIAVEIPQVALQSANGPLWEKLWMVYAALALCAFLVAGALVFVTHRNKALAQVMERVVDNLPLLLAYVDAEQRYRFNNMAYERFFGLKPREIYGKTMQELLGATAYHAVDPQIERALAGETVTFERQMAGQGGGLQDMVVSYLPDISPEGAVRGFYVMVNDVSLLKESERRDRQRMLELAHVSRLASMGEMATEIAHEINQPLAAISMYSAAGQRVLQGDIDRGQMRNWLEAINSQVKRASEIVRRVRRFAQKEEHQTGPVDLNQIARDVAALLDHEARSHDVEMVLELAEPLPAVQGEGVLLEQAVFNLARYALDGLLAQAGLRRITLRTSFDAQLVYVEVCDSGPPVDPALREHLFDFFVTGKWEGVGMNLSISRSIIETHAGTLHYAVSSGCGNIFKFSLTREAE
jgi:PAS domain S-box-containing protein